MSARFTLRRPSQRSYYYSRFIRRNYLSLIGLALVIALVIVGAFAPWIAPRHYSELDLQARLRPPELEHPLGTDSFGRDQLSRVIYGARVSLLVGTAATLIAMVLGSALGAIAGFYGGLLDEITMRVMDILLAFPYIVLAIAFMSVLGPGLGNVILVIALVRVPQFARLVRSSVLSVREREFVEASRALGVSSPLVLFRHVLPHCLSPVLVMASLSVAMAINAEAALSFLGLGVQPPAPSWGILIAEGRRYLFEAPWLATFPGLAIALAILAYNLLGDGLRDWADPRLRH